MAQTPSDLVRKIQILTAEAAKAGANQLAAEAQKWMPIHTNALRESEEVGQPEVQGNTVSVEIRYGNQNVKYAIPQYFRSFRHFMQQGEPQRIVDLRIAFDDVPSGIGDRALYQRTYREAVEQGLLRRVPNGLQWLDRALSDSLSRRKIDAAIGGMFR